MNARLLRLMLVAGLSIATSAVGIGPAEAAQATPPGPAAATSSAEWDGSIDLYRDGVFTTQKTWQWCTAAGVQIIRNIAEGDNDHSRRSQQGYFDWMRERNRYDLPTADGVDPTGWTAGLRHFVDDRYRLVASRSFDAAIRSAATSLRRTGLPVALTVANGGHGWIMTGFSASADPLATSDFTVQTVRIVGPLYGRQSRNGYDMAPDTELSIGRLRRFFTPWRFAPMAMVWDGRFVSIQPIAEGPLRVAPRPRPVMPAPRYHHY